MTISQQILLVGKPNSGKSLLFNQLTGLRQKVANYPGVTVDVKSGTFTDYELIDLPGIYTLEGLSTDELIAIDAIESAIESSATRLVVCVLDATRLERSLVLALDIKRRAAAAKKAVLFVLNMMDELDTFGQTIDTDGLAKTLGLPVVAISAKYRTGLETLQQQLIKIAKNPDDHLELVCDDEQTVAQQAKQVAKQFGVQGSPVLQRQNRLDRFFLHNVLGGAAFLFIMFLLFQSIFTLAAPLMDAVENGIGWLAAALSEQLPDGATRDFINDALFGGLGAFLVFVPQIMVLTLVISLLEDSGYLSRAALICHKPLSLFGLSGKSFIPLLSGHACAIPAIFAARSIESPHKRLITMMAIPLMSCSARLPVYALLIAALIPSNAIFLGVFSLQGAAFFGLYLFGIVMALLVSLLLSRTTKTDLKTSDLPFIIELPSYRLPHWRPLVQKVFMSGKQFVLRAGPVIFFVSVGIWVLGYFPQGSDLSTSWLGQIGHLIEPVVAPMGLDWRYGVAILMSFLAREVFVGALGTLFGMSDAEENTLGLAERLQADGLTLGAGIGLVLFYVVALQCVATVATLAAETGKKLLPWCLFVAYGALAYMIAVTANALF